MLRSIPDRLRKRPEEGVGALFVGLAGAEMLRAAEVIAADLSRDLVVVDLAAIVSKYIGETEKNLDRLFADAQQADLVLFFDEADAVFGKRTRVTEANDRYAEGAIASLAERMAAFGGLSILAINQQPISADPVLHRASVVVDFNSGDTPRSGP